MHPLLEEYFALYDMSGMNVRTEKRLVRGSIAEGANVHSYFRGEEPARSHHVPLYNAHHVYRQDI